MLSKDCQQSAVMQCRWKFKIPEGEITSYNSGMEAIRDIHRGGENVTTCFIFA
jgi:hypothetical protein